MKKIILFVLPVMVILASCNSTRVTTSWRDNRANVTINSFQKVLVLGLLSNKNRAVKERMEAQLAGTLKQQYGVNAVAASGIYQPKTFDNMTEAEALQKLQSDGVDAVITFALVDKNTSRNYNYGGWGWGPGFWGYYSAWRWGGFGWGAGWGPGYVTNNTKYIFETNLYDVTSNNKMIYSAQSESFDPNSSADLSIGYANSMVKDFQKQGFLAGGRR
ncbi:MAG: hypothetical protein LBE82_13900 [Chitinophagaceae bacterium]|jgi:hypothetical protein|nr:hypothetical protein [Chitinophagaceae bacterium]